MHQREKNRLTGTDLLRHTINNNDSTWCIVCCKYIEQNYTNRNSALGPKTLGSDQRSAAPTGPPPLLDWKDFILVFGFCLLGHFAFFVILFFAHHPLCLTAKTKLVDLDRYFHFAIIPNWELNLRMRLKFNILGYFIRLPLCCLKLSSNLLIFDALCATFVD